jgi:transposase
LEAVRTELAAVKAENVELRARLGQNSQNSSRPPSSDPPGVARPERKGRRRKRKRGGQPGHPAHFAAEPDHVNAERVHCATTCRRCHAELSEAELGERYLIGYRYGLPEIRPWVTAHYGRDGFCGCCGERTVAHLAPEVAPGDYEPSVQAMTALLRGELRQSVRQTAAVMTQVMHVPMSPAMVTKTQDQVSRALAAPVEEAMRHAQASDRGHVDETGWRLDKKRAWLWVLVAGLVTVFRVHASRGSKAAKELLGEGFRGIVGSDRWVGYTWLALTQRQLCWSHLKRDFKALLDYGAEARRLAERLLAER